MKQNNNKSQHLKKKNFSEKKRLLKNFSKKKFSEKKKTVEKFFEKNFFFAKKRLFSKIYIS